MKFRKGTEQTVWIIIALVIALIVAVVLITVFSKTSGNVDEQTGPTIVGGGESLSTTTCRLLCDSCKLSESPLSCYNDKAAGRCDSFDCYY